VEEEGTYQQPEESDNAPLGLEIPYQDSQSENCPSCKTSAQYLGIQRADEWTSEMAIYRCEKCHITWQIVIGPRCKQKPHFDYKAYNILCKQELARSKA